jgi:hypothetical protein
MPNTTNFNWPTPADTDLVKDGAAAIRNLGDGVDTSLVDLKGGTTGQILSKASNADMDFAFITPNVGDLTEVQAGVGISVASGTGPIPIITNSSTDLITTAGDLLYGTAADTVARLGIGAAGRVLKVNSGATAPEWAVDPTTDVVTTAGDLIYGTAADTVARLGIGTAGQVLKVNSGATAPEWGAAAASGGLTLINTGGTTLSGSSTTISSIPGTYKNLVVFVDGYYFSEDSKLIVQVNSDATVANYQQIVARGTGSTDNTYVTNAVEGVDCNGYNCDSPSNQNFTYLTFPNYASTTAKRAINSSSGFIQATGAKAVCDVTCYYASATAITALKFVSQAGTWSGGTVYVYGEN